MSPLGSNRSARPHKCKINWAPSWENLFLPYANNKGADLPTHPRSLISTFVVCCLDSIIPLVYISEISSLYLASVAAQGGLSLPRSQTPKTGFLVTRLNWCILETVKSQPESPPFNWEMRLSHLKSVPQGWDLLFPMNTNDHFFFSCNQRKKLLCH